MLPLCFKAIKAHNLGQRIMPLRSNYKKPPNLKGLVLMPALLCRTGLQLISKDILTKKDFIGIGKNKVRDTLVFPL